MCNLQWLSVLFTFFGLLGASCRAQVPFTQPLYASLSSLFASSRILSLLLVLSSFMLSCFSHSHSHNGSKHIVLCSKPLIFSRRLTVVVLVLTKYKSQIPSSTPLVWSLSGLIVAFVLFCESGEPCVQAVHRDSPLFISFSPLRSNSGSSFLNSRAKSTYHFS